MNSTYYKSCIVPQCKSTSINTPNKLLIHVPNNPQIRKKWLTLARRADAHCLSTKSRMYFCEDHFDLPNDMLNYTEYRVMGTVARVRMKPGCIPSKFGCHEDRRKRKYGGTERSYTLKKQRMTIIAECLKETEVEESDDLELNSDDKLSDDDALATFPSQPRQAPIASSSAGGGEDPRDDERCDSCRGGLSGIRLVCVQCSYSHCVACETSGRHRHHYMLRVPANGQKKVLERLVKIIQTELPEIDANYKSDADPSDEPLIIKTEIKTEEEEPDPLGEATIYTEQLRPEEVLEQTMLEIDKGCLGQVVDPPPAPAMQATTSAHPATNIIPTTGASVASKRRASSPTQPSAPKKVTSPQQYKTDPWTHQDDIDPHTPGEISIKTETSMPDMKGRGKKGRTTKKKVKQ
ncbi:uncharacterized protein LOC126377877 isoform X5 [Pectinophora gossypiella]|uniref:uncharacterized protein LOC126377877 isoform X5 n=1 Tax=Pectinophora gossypiella TaxID=13191 RepID=UPI00214F58B3|nr:uncharacterized protein LOC126377877 isoform X5 [Pectinophora gossypiella]